MPRITIKTVKDRWDDPVTIERLPSGVVGLTVAEGGGDPEREAFASLTPKQARKVAKALKKAAKQQ